MEGGLLVAAQLSSLFPASQATCITIQTERQNTPLPPIGKDTDPPPEHASYSSLLHTPVTGTILLRLLHGGLILELISLSTEVSPIRFIFPAVILSSPAIFLWESDELHVLAVTTTGSLYRLVVPIGGGLELWRDQVNNIWSREYLIKDCSGTIDGLVHVQGTHCVAIGLTNGALLRLETEYLGSEGSDDEWTESTFQQHGSFLSSLTSFLTAGNPTGSQIISMATHPWPTDIGDVWTLSRDRILRLWKPKIGCVAIKPLSLSQGRDSSPIPGSVAHGTSKVLLDAEHQTLLRVFSTPNKEDHLYVLAFQPSSTSLSSGGAFQILDTYGDQFSDIGLIHCSENSAHCHLHDFMVIGNVLYTLWDRQGQSMVEKTILNESWLDGEDLRSVSWESASYAPEAELTPSYLDEVLLSPGSLSDRFFEVITRPGMFSPLTLRTAVDQYTDACLSLPGTPPSPLMTSYASVGENIAAVVGCTVNLNRDPRTGALQYAQYWNALKRDWEGFIARCREVERSSRWPLVLGAQDQGDIIIVERERAGSLAKEDLPTTLCRTLDYPNPVLDSQYDLLRFLWTLRHRLGPQVMLHLENRLIDIMHQEIAFSFADILQDQAQRSNFQEQIDGGTRTMIYEQLKEITDMDAAIRTALDVIGGFDQDVKREEDEVELLLPPTHSDWARALAASYATVTANARYDLCISLMTLFYFLADEMSEWDPKLLAEVFAVFRGVATFRFVVRQPAGSSSKPVPEISAADEVVSLMRNMQVSHNRTQSTPSYSLTHRLLAQSDDNSHGIPAVAAHRFLDATGLIRSISPAEATQYEVLFCERLRLLGYYGAARELLSWLPRTPAVTYVLARLWLNIGRADDACFLMEKLAGSFGQDSALSHQDQQALLLVLPGPEVYDSPFTFYLHAAMLFRSHSLVSHEVFFTQLAISVSPAGVDTSALWHTVIKGHTELGMYDDAYAAWVASPYESQKRDSLSQLVYRICEDNAVDQLMTYNFAGFADDVEDALSFKARNVDPRIRPSYSRILYSWYTLRGDYRNAALTMYQRARKLRDLVDGNSSLAASLTEEVLASYTIAMNSLSLVDPKSAWIVIPGSVDNEHEPRKRRKLSKHIPENKYSPGKYEAEIVQLADIQYDHALLSAQMDIVRRDSSLLSSAAYLLPPSSIVLRLAQSNRFNQAMATARSLQVDMTDLFAHLTTQCLRLSRNPDAVLQQDTSDWLLTDNVLSWPGTPADRGWRYLRQSLERHDSLETDYGYTKVTFETILTYQKSPPPPWLIHSLENHCHEYLIRVSLRYENFDHAIEHSLSLIRKADARLTRDPPKNASSTWIPYNLIDQVLVAAAAQDSTPARLSEARSEIANWVKRMHRLSNFSH